MEMHIQLKNSFVNWLIAWEWAASDSCNDWVQDESINQKVLINVWSKKRKDSDEIKETAWKNQIRENVKTIKLSL